ncbi:MAG TPA: 2-hydroxychromene-2-carboxylate isomerase [Rhodocyclaceae bacterium]|jgi:2-hydroxychromene-2-carboxylate isomerase|nr:2-hydroxychromene-2-carboxylate isomerase [Rhodocyclaceae bacterium]
MDAPLDFYFDFSSPYGYLASELIDDLAARHGRRVAWHPILLGAVFRQTGSAPLTEIPLKGDYSKRDFARSARFLGIPFRMPTRFPLATQNAARAFLWLQDRDPARARDLAHALYRACFAEDIDISDTARLLVIADSLGLDKAALAAAVADPAIKDRLRAANDAAIARGVFGSPFVFVDGEPFWGVDRLPQIDKWLETGGF